jgi:hypothetical protein
MTTEISLSVVAEHTEIPSAEVEQAVLELKQEIEHGSNFSIPVNETQEKREGTLGPEWLPILVAILASPVVVEGMKGLIQIVNDWLKRRRPFKVILKGPKGSYTISGNNITPDDLASIARNIT